jgi:outer membrane protein TolC
MRVSILALLPAAALAQEPLRLTIGEAVGIALSPKGSQRVQIAAEGVRQAEARSAQARSALLPNIDGAVGYQSLTRNLEAFGIRIESPIPGFGVPAFVGPFNVFDARLTASQTILDLSAIRRLQASRQALQAARAETGSVDDLIAYQVARSYLIALRAGADVETAKANVELAQALVGLAESQKRAGTGTGIEVTRADVQLANERQRLLVAENQQRSARFQLLRAIGAPQDTLLELTSPLRHEPLEAVAVEQALDLAARERSDLKAQREREAAARLTADATGAERLPSLVALGDYGAIGTGVSSSRATRAVGVSLRVPVFDGGRRNARRAESESLYRAEQARTRDLEQQAALDVRLALDALRSAEEQVKVAEEGLKLAGDELSQAQRRYRAGVTTSVEVTDAQTRLARARDNRTAALYLFNQARIDYGQATGTIRSMLP